MLCQHCKEKTATFHYQEIVDANKKIDIHLCNECAEKLGYTKKLKDPLADFFTGLSSEPVLDKNNSIEQQNSKENIIIKCENCGMTYLEFMNKGKFGCAKCYTYFANELKPLLQRIHNSINHIGKKPIRQKEKFKFFEKIRKLQDELQQAVQVEDYLLADKLKRQIEELKQKV